MAQDAAAPKRRTTKENQKTKKENEKTHYTQDEKTKM
jgi:hypothetical protein